MGGGVEEVEGLGARRFSSLTARDVLKVHRVSHNTLHRRSCRRRGKGHHF